MDTDRGITPDTNFKEKYSSAILIFILDFYLSLDKQFACLLVGQGQTNSRNVFTIPNTHTDSVPESNNSKAGLLKEKMKSGLSTRKRERQFAQDKTCYDRGRDTHFFQIFLVDITEQNYSTERAIINQRLKIFHFIIRDSRSETLYRIEVHIGVLV